MKILLILLLVMACIAMAQYKRTPKELKEGDRAPEFSLLNHNGEVVSLSDFRGKKVALYFYPKDETSGCTQQACNLRDAFEPLNKAGITILGISKGSFASKQNFISKQHLNFPLIIATQEVIKEYGVDCGPLYFFFGWPKRQTFLINEDGIIVKIIKNVDTKNHAQQILEGFFTTS